ncbi:hypothetical protein [Chengkuizengella marina]|uniref:Uncharacterized protein n=1 Tax=Chengkuizengella marina TaxID=2507566 RepID=A0A6N9PXU1_9BACL|nr:hypothetical protein [Chengkuizengella marina]NBI28329.1 hypothetical protein [Chengkuizengella marina]
MGLKKGPFVVAQTFSVLDPYDPAAENIIVLPNDGDFEIVATVDVCVTQPKNTQVSLDSMAQIAVIANSGSGFSSTTFEVKYELLRNGDCIAIINDEMDYSNPLDTDFRHTNFPNFPVLDINPSLGINKYVLRCTRVVPDFDVQDIFVASRSLKATVFEC